MADSVVKKEQQQVATLDFSMVEADSGLGNKEVDQDTLSIPFLKTNLSKQILEANRGAVSGDMYNTVTGEIYDRDKGVLVLPCVFQRRFIQWSPLGDEQSAPIAIYSTKEECPATERSKEDNKEYLTDGSGHYIEDTHQHFVLVIDKDGTAQPALIAMKSTQLKKSRKWNSMVQGRMATGKDGRPFQMPRFSHVYSLKSVKEENSKGAWHGWDIALDKQVDDVSVYGQAKQFAQSIQAGDVNVKHSQDDENSGEVPF